jgi:hypothetical protein
VGLRYLPSGLFLEPQEDQPRITRITLIGPTGEISAISGLYLASYDAILVISAEMKRRLTDNSDLAASLLNGVAAFLMLSAVIPAVSGCGGARVKTAEPSGEKSAVELAREDQPAVELVIDYGDGVEKRFTRIPHQEGITALDTLEFADRHPRGIRFQTAGSGEAALVTGIDDLNNQTGGEGKNWLYRINGKLADKSAGAYVLAPGDVILWKYQEGLGVGD